MNADYSKMFVELSIRLGEIAIRNTASSISSKIKAAKAKKDDKETIIVLEEIINDLISDKNELIRISRAYEEELVAQKISDRDINYITENFIPVIKELLEKAAVFSEDQSMDEINNIVDILKPLVSVQTFNILQLLGFNFKAAIGQPLTRLVKDLIESKAIAKKEEDEKDKIEYNKLLTQNSIEYYKMLQDKEAYERHISLQKKNND